MVDDGDLEAKGQVQSPGTSTHAAAGPPMSLQDDSLNHAIAGSMGSALAMALTYPLDQLRTLQQVRDSRVSDTGEEPRGGWALLGGAGRTLRALMRLVDNHDAGVLYRGLIPVVASMGASNFVYFLVVSYLRGLLTAFKRKTGHDLGYLGQIAVNTAAAVINVLLTTPLWTTATRVKLSTAKGLGGNFLSVLRDIYRRDGVLALWAGTVPGLLLCCNPIIQHSVYDRLKTQALALRRVRRTPGARHSVGESLSSAEAFVFGAVSKAGATVISFPLQVAQTRLRAQEQERQRDESGGDEGCEGGGVQPGQRRAACPRSRGTFGCIRDLYTEGGIPALFLGLEAKLCATVSTAALMFCFYEALYKAVSAARKVKRTR